MRYKPTVKQLISDLGFCCPYAFWRANRKVRTGLIAERLGLDERVIRLHRADYKAGRRRCEDKGFCIRLVIHNRRYK